MRRLILSLSMVAAVAVAAQPAEAQLVFGPQVALMTGLEEASSLNGTFGAGGRVGFAPPLLPIGVVGQGVYYFPEGDVGYMTYGVAGILRLPLPMVSPYAIAGWQWRRASVGDVSATENGATVGLGVQLNLALSLFLEATMEFNEEDPLDPDFDTNPLVIQGGVLLGG